MPAVPDCAKPRWQRQTEPNPATLVVPGCAKPCRGSEGHAGAVVPQLAGQDAAVDLVELHQLDEVGEARLPVVHGEVEPTLLLALPGVCRSGPLSPAPPGPPSPALALTGRMR